MSKEELIDFIKSVDFEYCSNLMLTYCKMKPKNSMYISDEDKADMQPKTITFQKNIESLINENERWNNEKFDNLYSRINSIEETLDKMKEGK